MKNDLENKDRELNSKIHELNLLKNDKNLPS